MKFKLDAAEFFTTSHLAKHEMRCCFLHVPQAFSHVRQTPDNVSQKIDKKAQKTYKTAFMFEITAHTAKNVKKKQNFFAIFCFWSVP